MFLSNSSMQNNARLSNKLFDCNKFAIEEITECVGGICNRQRVEK